MRKGIIIGGVAAAVVLVAGIAAAANGSAPAAPQAQAQAQARAEAPAELKTPSPEDVAARVAAEAKAKADADAKAAKAAADAEAARVAAEAKAAADAEAARVAAEAAAAAAAADADPSTFQEIDSRTWALVAKDPAAHTGEKFVIYGKVTQFDSATGTSGFRANTDGEQQEKSYDYDVNTLVSAKDAGAVADIVEDDLVKMYVKVTGAKTYSTQMGGSTTAPQVMVVSHELIGHDD